MTEPKQGSVPISEGREQDRLEMRLDLLGRLLGSFESLELEEASRRIVDQTFEALQADRAWLLWMPQPDAHWATVVYERNDPEYPGAFTKGERIPLDPSRNLLARLRAATEPVAVYRGDPDLDPAIAERYQIRAQLLQLLRMPGSGAWVFGLHRCRSDRRWTQFEVDLFAEVGRLAAIAIHNAEIHRKATADAARLRATLEQIPIPAMIVNRQGEIEMVNPEAFRQGLDLAADLAERIETNAPRTIDGRALTVEELPGMRALRGEQVCEELILRDRQGEERTVEIRAAPIQDQDAEILGAVILLSDVTRERKAGWREKLRRRRAEAIAALGLDLLAESLNLNDLDGIAELIGKAISANVFLYFYRRDQDRLVLTGGYSESARWPAFRQYLTEHPFRVDEGLPGTAFSLRRPLLFSELKSNAIADFSRDETERELKESLDERSLIAYPIESKDEPIGVITLSLSGAGRVIDSDDLDFAHDIAERIGAANRIQELTRTTAESLRASEELARRETNARARLEAVLESAPVGIAVVSADELRFELVNARWIQLVEKVGRVADSSDLIDRQVGDEFPALDEQLKEVAESATPLVDEETEMMIGGERRYFNRIISPVRGRFSGSTQSLTVLLQDVT
ncbi:MAG TPA: GAF domain-containing protein, partial [Thermoanaerobaculia bacterium]|nr:GAF domain-containing protein [Thermoanaerobaculia bacterium]